MTKKCMIMANVEGKKGSCSKAFIKLMSKISFINKNVIKSILIIKNLQVNSRTEFAITLTKFFPVTSSFAKTICEKNEFK